jgi:hypothetical protein
MIKSIGAAGRRLANVPDQWLSHSAVDVPIVLVLLASHLLLVHLEGWPVLLEGVPLDRRAPLYGVAAIVISLTGTLVSVSVAQYLNGRGERVKALKTYFSRELGRTWRAIFSGSIVAAVLFLAAYAADVRYPSGSTETGETLGVWLFEAGVVLALVRLVRLAVLFSQLIDLIVLDDTDPLSGSDKVAVNPDFFDSPKQSRRAS